MAEAGMRRLGGAVLFLIASLVTAWILYELWIDLVVLRPDCGPYSCGWPGEVTWDATWAVFGFFFVVGGAVVWLVSRRAPYVVAAVTLGMVLWIASLAFVGSALDQHDKCSETIGGGPPPECGTLGELAWYFGDGWPAFAFFFLLAGAISLLIRRARRSRPQVQ
jgi:hypothetical protein